MSNQLVHEYKAWQIHICASSLLPSVRKGIWPVRKIHYGHLQIFPDQVITEKGPVREEYLLLTDTIQLYNKFVFTGTGPE